MRSFLPASRRSVALFGGLLLLALTLPVGAEEVAAPEQEAWGMIREAIRAGRTDEAIARLERHAQAFPQDREACYYLAVMRWRRGDVGGAGEAYRRLLVLDPQGPFAPEARLWLERQAPLLAASPTPAPTLIGRLLSEPSPSASSPQAVATKAPVAPSPKASPLQPVLLASPKPFATWGVSTPQPSATPGRILPSAATPEEARETSPSAAATPRASLRPSPQASASTPPWGLKSPAPASAPSPRASATPSPRPSVASNPSPSPSPSATLNPSPSPRPSATSNPSPSPLPSPRAVASPGGSSWGVKPSPSPVVASQPPVSPRPSRAPETPAPAARRSAPPAASPAPSASPAPVRTPWSGALPLERRGRGRSANPPQGFLKAADGTFELRPPVGFRLLDEGERADEWRLLFGAPSQPGEASPPTLLIVWREVPELARMRADQRAARERQLLAAEAALYGTQPAMGVRFGGPCYKVAQQLNGWQATTLLFFRYGRLYTLTYGGAPARLADYRSVVNGALETLRFFP